MAEARTLPTRPPREACGVRTGHPVFRLLAISFLLLLGCGKKEEPGPNRGSGLPPSISRFAAIPPVIRAGTAGVLQWEVSGADRFQLLWREQNTEHWSNPDGAARQFTTPVLDQDTCFELTAMKNGSPDASAVLTVQVTPAVVRLTALPAAVTPGGTTTLTYRILGRATRLTVMPGNLELPVEAPGSIDHYWTTPPITETTTFTLTASNAAGSDVMQLTVPVGSAALAPQIQSFTASPATVAPGGSTTLAWSILGEVDRLVLNPGEVPIGTTGSHRVDGVVAGANTFTLTATNATGSTSASLTVNLDTSGASIRVTPASATTTVGVPVALSALVSGLSNPSVTWSSTPSAGATWSQAAGGAPTWRFTQTGTYAVRATSVERPDLWAEATVTVLPERVSVALSPPSTILKEFSSQTFTASVAGTTDSRLAWTCSGGGTLTPGPDGSAVFQAIERPGTFQVTATSVAGGSAGLATVTIPDRTSSIQFLSLTTQALTLSRSQIPAGGEARRFAATITGASPGGAASFNGGWDWEIPAGAGTARTAGYACVQPSGGSLSAMHTLEWLIPASVPLGTHTVRLRPWIDPTLERTLTLTVQP